MNGKIIFWFVIVFFASLGLHKHIFCKIKNGIFQMKKPIKLKMLYFLIPCFLSVGCGDYDKII